MENQSLCVISVACLSPCLTEQGENNRMAAFARTASGLGQLSPSSTSSPTTTTSLACMEEKDLREIAKVLGDIPRVVVIHPDKSKTIFFIRHAEALHNEAFKTRGRSAYLDPAFLDPALTPLGQAQSETLGEKLSPKLHKVDLVVVSPLKRTLETADISMNKLSTIPWLANELVRERIGVHPCDKRRPISIAKSEYPAVDFSLIQEEEDLTWTESHRETPLEIAQRGVAFLQWLGSRPEESVAVVTHSAFLMSLFNQVLSCPTDLQAWFENGELRQVTLSF